MTPFGASDDADYAPSVRSMLLSKPSGPCLLYWAFLSTTRKEGPCWRKIPPMSQLYALFTENRCHHLSAHGLAAVEKDSEDSIALSF